MTHAMNRIYAAVIAAPLALAGCAGVQPSTETNAVLCMTTLLESGSWEPLELAKTAAVTPSCQALAADVLSNIINRVVPQNKALARAQGRLR